MPTKSEIDALCLEGASTSTRSEARRLLRSYDEDNLSDDHEEPDARRGVLQGLPSIVPSVVGRSYGSLFQNNNNNHRTSTTDASVTTAATISTYGLSESSYEDIPVPLKLRPFVKRLEDFATEVTEEEIYRIIFIIRLADAMLKVAYAAFLTQSFVDELRKKLQVEDLEVEIEIAATRWTYQQGAIMTYHRFSSDYDGFAMHQLSRIALGVMEESITVTEALKKIQACEDRTEGPLGATYFRGIERFYRRFPGRILIWPLLSSTGAVVYFNATGVDFLVCVLTGTVAGLINYYCSKSSNLAGVEEMLVSISIAFLSALSKVLIPNAVCFPAQCLGALFAFLYGISFVQSLYEITQNLVMTGLTRFFVATLRSFALAFGVALGLGAWQATPFGEQLNNTVSECKNLSYTIDPLYYIYLYPIVSIGALMHLRVSPKHWPICLITQLLSLRVQFVLSVLWKQPVFISNFAPAYIATITAHLLIVFGHRFNLTSLAVKPTAFLMKRIKKRKDIKEPVDAPATPHMTIANSPNILRFVDKGWADQGDTRQGYRRNNRFQYQRSDLWFCLVPALYLLVPGAAIWRIAFFSIVETSSQQNVPIHENSASFQALASGVFVVGMGQVMGIRLALASLWGCTEIWRKRFANKNS